MARKRPPSATSPTLLAHTAQSGVRGQTAAPLADRMRPRALAEVVGQAHLVAEGRWLADAIAKDRLPSLILWGPPGSGKTTLAHVVAESTRAVFVPFNAVLGGVAELREILKDADERRAYQGQRTILFVDEIHRFNKSQQDAFLPHVERGAIVLVGATTENPSFAVNAALISRCKVLRLEALSEADVRLLLERALQSANLRLTDKPIDADDDALVAIARAARGDARRALGLLESAVLSLGSEAPRLTLDAVTEAAGDPTLLYDKSGEEHYNVVSAFIKSMRGSDPDAALYWMLRMLDAGEDPLFVSRRMIIFASEDVGNADPRAIALCVAADDAFRRMGMPEGLFPLAHACLYLASCPKSGAVKAAIGAARAMVREHGALPVPLKLRNAPTKLMKRDGYGDGYQYPHDFEGSFVPGETYLPTALEGRRFYEPSDQGLEAAIRQRLERLRKKGQ